MDDNAVRTITPEEAQRAPRDLDDLIFQGEPWWVSDRWRSTCRERRAELERRMG